LTGGYGGDPNIEQFGGKISSTIILDEETKLKITRKRKYLSWPTGALAKKDAVPEMIYAEIDTLWTGDVTAPTAIEVPLLFENNLEGYFSSTICVYSSYAKQLSRSIVFRRWGDDELRKRMAAQLPMREKIRCADFAIGNCGTKLQFERQIQLLLEKIIAAAGQ
jgi:dephospho-CoA kinase